MYPVKVGEMVGLTLGDEIVGDDVGAEVGRSEPHCICTEYDVEVDGVRHTVNPLLLTDPSLSHTSCVPSDTATFLGPLLPLHLWEPT